MLHGKLFIRLGCHAARKSESNLNSGGCLGPLVGVAGYLNDTDRLLKDSFPLNDILIFVHNKAYKFFLPNFMIYSDTMGAFEVIQSSHAL